MIFAKTTILTSKSKHNIKTNLQKNKLHKEKKLYSYKNNMAHPAASWMAENLDSQTLANIACGSLEENKILKAEIEALKAPKDHAPSDGLKTFVETSPLVKEVKALRKQNEKLKEDIKDLQNDYKELELEHEAHKIEHQELIDDIEEHPLYEEALEKGIDEYTKEIRKLKEALNKVRRDLSPER